MLNFTRAFKETQDFFKIPNEEFARQINRAQSSLSRLRNGKSSPTLIEFSQMLELADQHNPGFKNEYLRRLNAPHTTLSPQELVDSLSTKQIAELMTAIGNRIVRNASTNDNHQRAA